MNVLDQYTELLGLTRRYLLQEHNLNDKLLADSETYTYFRNFVANRIPPKSPPAMISSAPIRTTAIPITMVPPTHIPTVDAISAINLETAIARVASAVPIVPIPSVEKEASLPHSLPAVSKLKDEPEVKAGTMFVPEPSSSVAVGAVDVSEIRKILEKHTSIRFFDVIPSDAEAKKKARNWEQEQLTQVLIVTFNDSPRHNNFLENLRFAIEGQGWSAKVAKGMDVEKNKTWSALLASKTLHLVIATSGDIETSAELKKLCRETAQPAKHTLGGIPLLLLADPATYMMDPHLKQLLWKSLKELLVRTS